MMRVQLPWDEELDERGATFSECKGYRYTLWRRWARDPMDVWLMLNPSTADAVQNDPTVERCERRSRTMGAGGIIVLNVFAWRSTDPRGLRRVADPEGPLNRAVIRDVCLGASQHGAIARVICAWGGHGKDRGMELALFLHKSGVPLAALKLSKDGTPCHPLYLPYELQPRLWVPGLHLAAQIV